MLAFDDDITRLAQVCASREEWCARRASKLRSLSNLGTATSIVLAAAAGVTVLPEGVSRYLGAALAFLSAVVGGLTAAFQPDKQAHEMWRHEIQYSRLKDDALDLARAHGATDPRDVSRRFRELRDRRYSLDAAVRGVKIEDGDGRARPSADATSAYGVSSNDMS